MAKLPVSKKIKRIADMGVDEICFTTPLAMWVNLSQDCFLNQNFEASADVRGDLKLKVLKLKNGYIVFIHEVDYTWSPRENHNFSTADEDLCYGEVLGFRYDENIAISMRIEEAIEAEDYELAAELQKELK